MRRPDRPVAGSAASTLLTAAPAGERRGHQLIAKEQQTGGSAHAHGQAVIPLRMRGSCATVVKRDWRLVGQASGRRWTNHDTLMFNMYA